MQLEDHAGDIAKKARVMNGLLAPVVAQAVGITRDELTAFEQTGSGPQKIDFTGWARRWS